MRKARCLCVVLSSLLVATAIAHAEIASTATSPLTGTWTIINETADTTYSGTTATGQVTFFDDHLTLDSGGFAAAGLVSASLGSYCSIPLDPISFKFVGEAERKIMYLTWTGRPRNGESPHPQDAIMNIVKFEENRMTMIGNGGCGRSTPSRISHLERVQ